MVDPRGVLSDERAVLRDNGYVVLRSALDPAQVEEAAALARSLQKAPRTIVYCCWHPLLHNVGEGIRQAVSAALGMYLPRLPWRARTGSLGYSRDVRGARITFCDVDSVPNETPHINNVSSWVAGEGNPGYAISILLALRTNGRPMPALRFWQTPEARVRTIARESTEETLNQFAQQIAQQGEPTTPLLEAGDAVVYRADTVHVGTYAGCLGRCILRCEY